MGTLYYGADAQFSFDDRLLTHLRTVILGKLSLQESFVFSWVDERQQTLWLHPSIPIRFEFSGKDTPEINPVWIEQLYTLANSPSGLRITEEPSGK